MEGTKLRAALPEGARQLSAMARAMVTDMAGYGGHPVSADEASWDKLADTFKEQIENADCRYLVAESSEGELLGFAAGEVHTASQR